MNKSSTFFKLASISLLILLIIAVSFKINSLRSEEAISSYGDNGNEVSAIQQALKDRGLFNSNVTGYYGDITEKAVKDFQKQQGIETTGTAGPQTLRALGITVGRIPEATEANINLLARMISAESKGEPYVGQVAIGAVILNRIEHPSFPDTLSEVLYQPGAFAAVTNGEFDKPVSDTAYEAARDALNGWDPTGGCIYYYNPDKTSNQWIRTRTVYTTIGNHIFCI